MKMMTKGLFIGSTPGLLQKIKSLIDQITLKVNCEYFGMTHDQKYVACSFSLYLTVRKRGFLSLNPR